MNPDFLDIEVGAYNTSYTVIPPWCIKQFPQAFNEVCIMGFLASNYLAVALSEIWVLLYGNIVKKIKL